MPLHIIPRRLFAHRIACKALYRALLLQIPRIPLPKELKHEGPVNPIKHLLRKGFKRNIHVTSPRLVVRELERGYRAEELLRNAGDGNTAAIGQIHALLLKIEREKELARESCTRPLVPSPPAKPRHRVSPYPGASKVLDVRPLPKEKLTGRRRVPILTAATWLPFLRFKRPQSPYLSRVIRDKLRQKQRRFNNIAACEDANEIAEAEMLWERKIVGEVEKELGDEHWEDRNEKVDRGEKEERMGKWLEGEGREWGFVVRKKWWNSVGEVDAEGREIVDKNEERNGDGGWKETSAWAVETRKVRKDILRSVFAEQNRSKKVGKRMLEIVEKEKEMWEKERREKKDAKRGGVGKIGKAGGESNGNGGGSDDGGDGSVKWKIGRVEMRHETEGRMMERKKDIPIRRYKAGREENRSSQRVTLEAERVDTKAETQEDMMERKLKTMQLSQRNAEKAYKNARATF